MRALLGTEFATLWPAQTSVRPPSPVSPAYTTRQLNNWCRAGAAVPPWAEALAILLQDASPSAIQILLEEVSFSWHETLGVPPNADAGTIRRAWARLAHAHHPGDTQEQMARLNAAYERAGRP